MSVSMAGRRSAAAFPLGHAMHAMTDSAPAAGGGYPRDAADRAATVVP
jgi:hypothetical protein